MYSQLSGAIALTLYAAMLMADGVDFQRDVRPILDRKCVVCHACYDAPCQLVLTHADGLLRGANKQTVYDGLRVKPAQPSRLHVDALSREQWRERGFFSVLPEAESGGEASVLRRMLLMRDNYELRSNRRLPKGLEIGLKRNNLCPQPGDMESYQERYPFGGMPLGVSGLSASERKTLLAWLDQGAAIEVAPVSLSAPERAAIGRWEAFLNRGELRRRLVSRWLYEHLFMAHLHFPALGSERFFELVRSSTPPGKPPVVIATRRPNDDPGQRIYYRLRPVAGTIVQKTHVTFPLDAVLRARIESLFFEPDWTVGRLPGYGDKERANPFMTFLPVPSEARYRFMLDHAEYFVETFIRGPVCHGQIATDVIRDQFWVLFQAPRSDLYVTSPGYRDKVTPFMAIAGVEQDLLEGARTWIRVRQQYDRYSDTRQAAYASRPEGGAGLEDIWDGEGWNDNALLSVFRHHDNASVRKGLIGDYPLTVWWMDYPLLERGYYNLVVNFDVFGSIAHQAQTRFYFDLIRNDAERNFLRLMPPAQRQRLIDRWYDGAAQLKLLTSYQNVSKKMPPAVAYKTDSPKRELLERLVHRFAGVNARPDAMNRASPVDAKQLLAPVVSRLSARALSGLASQRAAELPAVADFPEVSFVRVFDNSGRREIYTVLRNRVHTNVAFLFGESLRYRPEDDTLTVYPGVLASYPNFIFNVPLDEVEDFTQAVLSVGGERTFEKQVVRRWGVRRTHPAFWTLFHDLSAYLHEHTPVDAGVMDMSRYQNL